MIRAIVGALLMLPLASCLAGAVVSTTVKTTGAVAGTVIPHHDRDEDRDHHD